jgi:glucans biosynthesis protein C
VNNQRLIYLDNLRALAMLAGVVFHAALAYSPIAQPFFPTADRQNSLWIDVPIWFLHLFRMPLFFVIAGYFCALLVQKRGMLGMLADRARRIGLVFVLFWPVIYWSLKHSTEIAAAQALHPSPVLLFLRSMSTKHPNLILPPTTNHLWFLYYLIWFYVLSWCITRLDITRAITRPFAALDARGWLGLMPLLLVPSLAFVPAPHPAPESVLPQFWAIGFYGCYFALGHAWHTHQHSAPNLLATLESHASRLLIASIGLYGVFLSLLKRQISGQDTAALMAYAMKPQSYTLHWLIALCEAYISAWMCVVCLSYGKRFLNNSSRWLSVLSQTSYWSYLVHLPVLFLIQYQLMDFAWHFSIKLAAAVGLTLSVCLLSYWVFRKPWLALLDKSRS